MSPATPKRAKRNVMLRVRMTEHQYQTIDEYARAREMTISAYVESAISAMMRSDDLSLNFAPRRRQHRKPLRGSDSHGTPVS